MGIWTKAYGKKSRGVLNFQVVMKKVSYCIMSFDNNLKGIKFDLIVLICKRIYWALKLEVIHRLLFHLSLANKPS